MTGLVLAGGGVKGSYQIGAYLALKKCGVAIDGVVGTSIGSFNAALICAGMEKELYNFWKNVDIGELLEFNPKYTESVNNKEKFKELIYGIEQMTIIVKNKGITSSNLKRELDRMIDEDKIMKSKMDYGLVTVSVSDLKPLYLFGCPASSPPRSSSFPDDKPEVVGAIESPSSDETLNPLLPFLSLHLKPWSLMTFSLLQ